MSDRETQKAINETLREIRERQDEKWEFSRRQRNKAERRARERGRSPRLVGSLSEGRMFAYSRAKEIVREYIERPPPPKDECDPGPGERKFEIKRLPKE
jgi:hypothetical protein